MDEEVLRTKEFKVEVLQQKPRPHLLPTAEDETRGWWAGPKRKLLKGLFVGVGVAKPEWHSLTFKQGLHGEMGKWIEGFHLQRTW